MQKTKKIALMGLFLAMIIVLSVLEQQLPPMPFLPPGVKPGLANIVTMYCVLFVGKRQAVVLNGFKSVFVLITRGPVAGLLSFSGGMLSVGAVALLVVLWGSRASFIALGVAGAVAHNLAQLAVCIWITQTPRMLYYGPVLLAAGVLMGVATGTLLKVLLPVLGKLRRD